MDFHLAQAVLFAAIPPLAFVSTIGAASFKPDMPSQLGKALVRYVWLIVAWSSLSTFVAYSAWVSGHGWLAVAAAVVAFPAYVALGTVVVFSRRAFALGKQERR